MTPEIKKVYAKLSKSSNLDIAKEANAQLKFESGANSEDQKKQARVQSMTKLSMIMMLEYYAKDEMLDQLVRNTFMNAYDKYSKKY
jgi:hypothetical protein